MSFSSSPSAMHEKNPKMPMIQAVKAKIKKFFSRGSKAKTSKDQQQARSSSCSRSTLKRRRSSNNNTNNTNNNTSTTTPQGATTSPADNVPGPHNNICGTFATCEAIPKDQNDAHKSPIRLDKNGVPLRTGLGGFSGQSETPEGLPEINVTGSTF